MEAWAGMVTKLNLIPRDSEAASNVIRSHD